MKFDLSDRSIRRFYRAQNQTTRMSDQELYPDSRLAKIILELIHIFPNGVPINLVCTICEINSYALFLFNPSLISTNVLFVAVETFPDILDKIKNIDTWNNVRSAVRSMRTGFKASFLNEQLANVTLADLDCIVITSEIYELKVKSQPNYFPSVPSDRQTQAMCNIAMEDDPCNIKYVNPQFICGDHAVQAVKKNPHNLVYVPEELCNVELYMLAVSIMPDIIFTMNPHILTGEILEQLARLAPTTLVNLVNHRTMKIYRKTGCKKFCSEMESKLSTDIYRIAFNQDPTIFKHIPYEKKDEAMCIQAMLINIKYIKYVSFEFINEDHAKLAVENGISLYHIPNPFITMELCKIALERDPTEIDFVPYDLVLSKMCLNLILADPNLLEYVSHVKLPSDVYQQAIKTNPHVILHIPSIYLTEELCVLAISEDVKVFTHIVLNYLTENLCCLAVSIDPDLFRSIPAEHITENIIRAAYYGRSALVKFAGN